jgi:hypothetical protein
MPAHRHYVRCTARGGPSARARVSIRTRGGERELSKRDSRSVPSSRSPRNAQSSTGIVTLQDLVQEIVGGSATNMTTTRKPPLIVTRRAALRSPGPAHAGSLAFRALPNSPVCTDAGYLGGHAVEEPT